MIGLLSSSYILFVTRARSVFHRIVHRELLNLYAKTIVHIFCFSSSIRFNVSINNINLYKNCNCSKFLHNYFCLPVCLYIGNVSSYSD